MPFFVVVAPNGFNQRSVQLLAWQLAGVWSYDLLLLLISCIFLNVTYNNKGIFVELNVQTNFHLLKRIFCCLRQCNISASYFSRRSFFRLTWKKKKKMEKQSDGEIPIYTGWKCIHFTLTLQLFSTEYREEIETTGW